MEILIGLICTLLLFYVIIDLFIQYTDIVLVNLFRIKQIIAFILAICLCLMPFVIKTEAEWVFTIFSIAISIFFFIESYISRDDFYAWLEVVEDDIEEQEGQEKQGEDKEK